MGHVIRSLPPTTVAFIRTFVSACLTFLVFLVLSRVCFSRSHALTEAGCVVSLKKIAEDASPATRERVALCFRRLATEPLNRGLIVQQGGLVRLG